MKIDKVIVLAAVLCLAGIMGWQLLKDPTIHDASLAPAGIDLRGGDLTPVSDFPMDAPGKAPPPAQSSALELLEAWQDEAAEPEDRRKAISELVTAYASGTPEERAEVSRRLVIAPLRSMDPQLARTTAVSIRQIAGTDPLLRARAAAYTSMGNMERPPAGAAPAATPAPAGTPPSAAPTPTQMPAADKTP